MKKIILISILCLIGMSSQAQTTDSIMSVSELPGAIYEDTKAALTQIAEGLGTTAEYVWPIMIKQQVVNSITWLIVYILAFIIISVLSYLEWKVRENRHITGMFATAAIVFSVFLLIALLFTISDVVTGFVNPEYGAIKEIIDMIK